MALNFTKDQIYQYFNSNIDKYKSSYSESKFFNKIIEVAKKAGAKVAYSAFRIFYTLKIGNLSTTEKLLVIAALGYFITPIDLIPDFMSVVGLTDDLIVLAYVNSVINDAITPEIDLLAREQVKKYFGQLNFDELL